MVRFRTILSAVLVLLSAAACQRRPFAERTTGVELVLSIDTRIVNCDEVELPEMMRVDLFDPVTGEVRYTDYVGPRGGYIYPAPGTYDLMVYNIGTENTQVRNESRYREVEAYTTGISDFLKSQLARFLARVAQERAMREQAAGVTRAPETEPIVYQPDHIFVGRRENVTVPVRYFEDDAEEIVIEVGAETLVETWKVEMVNVVGMKWITDAVAVVSGQAESTFMAAGEDSDGIVSIYFEQSGDADRGTLTGFFNTFGRYPGELDEIGLDVNIKDLGGGEHHFHFDVTEDFDDNPEQVIVIDGGIVIEEPAKEEGGGFDPKVDDWEDINTDIIL